MSDPAQAQEQSPSPASAPAPATADPQLVTVSTLTEEQQKVLHFVYDSAKGFAAEVFARSSLPAALQITQLMAGIMKQMETLEFAGSKLTGATKKAVAIELGRTLIADLIQDATVKAVILPLYDTMADSLLETMIDVSQHVNVAVKGAKETMAGCCEWMAACLRK